MQQSNTARNPVDQFIIELGGCSEVARKLGIGASTVNGWQLKGKIPKWRIPALAALAFEKGKPLPMDQAA